jgi:hypothetical protein
MYAPRHYAETASLIMRPFWGVDDISGQGFLGKNHETSIKAEVLVCVFQYYDEKQTGIQGSNSNSQDI